MPAAKKKSKPVKSKTKKKTAKPARKKLVKTAAQPAAKKTVKKVAAQKKPKSGGSKRPAKKVAAKKGLAKASVPKKGLTRKSAAPTPVITQPPWPPLVMEVLAQLDDSKAEDVIAIDLSKRSTVADTMVVASGRSNRHVNAIADQAVERLEKMGLKNIRIEGVPQCDWVLVDAGDIILHIFRPEVRSFYNLEKLWSDHAP